MSTEDIEGEPLVSHLIQGDELWLFGSSSVQYGDLITFSGVYVDPWWKRALRWLHVLPKRTDPPLQQFVVTWIGEDEGP